jgi:hypothetical protein
VMLPAGEVRIYLACGVTDMRKGFHSLAAQVQTALNHDPYSGALYIFRGRRGQRATFCIQFAVCEDCLSVAPAVRSYASGISLSARQGSEVYLHGGAARPLP